MGFDETIISCASPALCGIKPSCLFSMKKDIYESGKNNLKDWNYQFAKENKHIAVIKNNSEKLNLQNRKKNSEFSLFFVYDKDLLKNQFKNPCIKSYLKKKNYNVNAGSNAILAELLHRLSNYSSFPHEVGVFLGYPLEDVLAFENQSEEKCKYSGLWKVFGDIEQAKKKMELYKDCTQKCKKYLQDGYSVPLATKKYRNANSKSNLNKL